MSVEKKTKQNTFEKKSQVTDIKYYSCIARSCAGKPVISAKIWYWETTLRNPFALKQDISPHHSSKKPFATDRRVLKNLKRCLNFKRN